MPIPNQDQSKCCSQCKCNNMTKDHQYVRGAHVCDKPSCPCHSPKSSETPLEKLDRELDDAMKESDQSSEDVSGKILDGLDRLYSTDHFREFPKMVDQSGWERDFNRKFPDMYGILPNRGDLHGNKGQPVHGDAIKGFIRQLILSQSNALKEEWRKNVGLLRQWLNEKPNDRLVTNEDIMEWLNLLED